MIEGAARSRPVTCECQCDECEGIGRVDYEGEFRGYEADCRQCHGTGYRWGFCECEQSEEAQEA